MKRRAGVPVMIAVVVFHSHLPVLGRCCYVVCTASRRSPEHSPNARRWTARQPDRRPSDGMSHASSLSQRASGDHFEEV